MSFLKVAKNEGPNIVHHGRYLETWYLEAGRDLGTSEADTEVGVL